MTKPQPQRLPSTHLEDLAYIVLSARAGEADFDLYPDVNDALRSRLRSRIKQLSRYDWPSCVREDPDFRRGLTLQQCYRLMIALLLLDVHLPPSLAVMIAQNNEVGFFHAIATSLGDAGAQRSPGHLSLAVILATEIQESLQFPGRASAEEDRVRFVDRDNLGRLWSDDLAHSGARIIIDIAASATALWRWISERRLMDDTARLQFLAWVETLSDHAFYDRRADRKLRR